MTNNHYYFNDFIQLSGHRVAYNKFINSLNQKLAIPVTAEQSIDYLHFSRLTHGDKQEIYRVFAELLSVDGILKPGRGNGKSALFRWVCSRAHSNLEIFPQTMERAVSLQIRMYFNEH